ncbi:DoxX family protein [Nocardia miyunensis]|uniref:DoxX family protein n=1 Tax=Nocardia miyunensis TaxID=282684 RepID=UPI00082BE893|nr:DoxX family protein [Nocardia miyunensis]
MSAVVTEQNSPEIRPEESVAAAWNPFTRIAFRFLFVYLGLFGLTIPQITMVFMGWFRVSLPEDSGTWLERLAGPTLSWVGRMIFGANDVRLYPNGSGDQAIYWVWLFCVLVIALVVTAVWSLLDRRRLEYRTLAGWSLVVLRVLLGGQMLLYGFVKLIPTQMPAPTLTRLLEPYGQFTPMMVLWSQVGSSRPYEMLLGLAEVLAGLMLFIPRTALLGAMLSLVDLAQVFVLNMTFDVPVKILSAHLLLASSVLLAPEARRLVTVLLLGRAAGPSTAPYPFRTPRARRIATLVQVLLAIWVVVGLCHMQWQTWHSYGPGRPKPPLYGIWTVTRFTRDGQDVPPLVTDRDRWYRVIFDSTGELDFQHMDGTLDGVLATVDPAAHRITITAGPKRPGPTGELTFQQPAPDRAVLTGALNGHPVSIDLEHFDADRLPLRSSGFHWVQNNPHR